MTRHRALALLAFILAAIAFLFLPTVARSFHDWSAWALNDLHVDYAGGLVRRGLLGELAYQLRLLGIGSATFFGLLFLVLAAVQTALLGALAWPLAVRWPALFLLVMLSPALLLFPAYDPGAYLRRDVFIVIGILAHALTVRATRNGEITAQRYERLVLLALAPYLLLAIAIHENQVFFVPLHLVLVALGAGGFTASRATIRNIVAIAALTALAAVLVVVYRGNGEIADRICQSWTTLAPKLDCAAIKSIGWNLTDPIRLDLRIIARPTSLLIYLASFALALLPMLAVREAHRLDGHSPLPWRLFGLAIAPLLVLFALGWDWGRWISLIAFSSLALFLAVLPTSRQARSYVARTGGFFMLALALVYVSTWKLNHCCAAASLDGGLIPSLVNSLKLVLGLS